MLNVKLWAGHPHPIVKIPRLARNDRQGEALQLEFWILNFEFRILNCGGEAVLRILILHFTFYILHWYCHLDRSGESFSFYILISTFYINLEFIFFRADGIRPYLLFRLFFQ